jgi:hypothetical protein
VGVLAYGGVLWKLRSRLHLSALRSLLPGRRRKGGEQ